MEFVRHKSSSMNAAELVIGCGDNIQGYNLGNVAVVEVSPRCNPKIIPSERKPLISHVPTQQIGFNV